MSALATGLYEITTGETPQTVQVSLLSRDGGVARYRIVVDGGEPIEVDVTRPEDGVWTLLRGDDCFDVGVSEAGESGELSVDVRGHHHEVLVQDPRRKALQSASSDGAGTIRTQMPGRVIRVLVTVGEEVEKGQPVVVVEAMKMENEIKAPRAGAIARVLVAEGDLVESKATLIELE
jgi:biotin carboxyl carrier protein